MKQREAFFGDLLDWFRGRPRIEPAALESLARGHDAFRGDHRTGTHLAAVHHHGVLTEHAIVSNCACVHQPETPDRDVCAGRAAIDAVGDVHCTGVAEPAVGTDVDALSVGAKRDELPELGARTDLRAPDHYRPALSGNGGVDLRR